MTPSPPQRTPDPDDKRVKLYLMKANPLPTVEQIAALSKAITGRDPTPEEIAEARRILDETPERERPPDAG